MKTNAKGNAFIRKSMFNALLAFMEEKPFQEISISDITRRANVSRMAYYRNYSSKVEILTSHLKDCVSQYEQLIQSEASGEPRITQRNIARLFECCKEQEKFVLECDNAGLGYYVQDAFAAYLFRYFKQEGKRREYVLNAYASALYSTVVKWLRNGANETAEEMAQMLFELYGPHV